jgi:hypothetical protein
LSGPGWHHGQVSLEPSFEAQVRELLQPAALHTRQEVLTRPCPVPASPGVYAWYFDEAPPGVPLDGCHRHGSEVLFYVGISPKAPPKNGGKASGQSLRTRVRYHYRGNAEGSTLRLTLGCLLSPLLGIELRRVGSGQRFTFSEGEEMLSDWMGRHARVCWTVFEQPWLVENELIDRFVLPLNLDQNKNSGFRGELSSLRATQRAQARILPVIST